VKHGSAGDTVVVLEATEAHSVSVRRVDMASLALGVSIQTDQRRDRGEVRNR